MNVSLTLPSGEQSTVGSVLEAARIVVTHRDAPSSDLLPVVFPLCCTIKRVQPGMVLWLLDVSVEGNDLFLIVNDMEVTFPGMAQNRTVRDLVERWVPAGESLEDVQAALALLGYPSLPAAPSAAGRDLATLIG